LDVDVEYSDRPWALCTVVSSVAEPGNLAFPVKGKYVEVTDILSCGHGNLPSSKESADYEGAKQ
jgi:hypothetical protein